MPAFGSRPAWLILLAVAAALIGGCSGEDDPTTSAEQPPGSGVLLVHRVTCFCTAESLTTTTIHWNGRAITRFDGMEPVRFTLDDDEISEIEDALAQVDFMELSERIERGEGASPNADLRAIKLTHDGHTVRERTHFDLPDRPPRIGDEPPEPLPLILAPVDQLIEDQLASEVRPEVERRSDSASEG